MPFRFLLQKSQNSQYPECISICKEKPFGDEPAKPKLGLQLAIGSRASPAGGLANAWPVIENINDTAPTGLVSLGL